MHTHPSAFLQAQPMVSLLGFTLRLIIFEHAFCLPWKNYYFLLWCWGRWHLYHSVWITHMGTSVVYITLGNIQVLPVLTSFHLDNTRTLLVLTSLCLDNTGALWCLCHSVWITHTGTSSVYVILGNTQVLPVLTSLWITNEHFWCLHHSGWITHGHFRYLCHSG